MQKNTIQAILNKINEQIVTVGTTSMRTIESIYWYGVKLIVDKETTDVIDIQQWDPYCPAMANALNNVYLSGDYPFYYVALVALSGEHEEAFHRLKNELNLQGYPSAWFDGGKKVILGGVSNAT